MYVEYAPKGQLRIAQVSNLVVLHKHKLDANFRAEGPAICLAQAIGLGIETAFYREG